MKVLPTRWRRKPAGIDMERNYVTVTPCIRYVNCVSKGKRYRQGTCTGYTAPMPYRHCCHRMRQGLWNDTVSVRPSVCLFLPTAAFPFLIQDSLHGFPRLFTVTSEHIPSFLFSFFLFLHFLVVGSVR